MGRTLQRSADFILQYDWILIGILALPLMFPSPGRTPFMLLLPLLWGLRWRRQGAPIRSTPLNLPLLLMALMLLVSLWATFSIEFSLPKIAGMLLGFAVFFSVVQHACTPRGWLIALTLFLTAGLGVTAMSALGANWAQKFPVLGALAAKLPALAPTLPGAEAGIHANQAAGALLWFLPLLWALSTLVFSRRFPWPRKLWFLRRISLGALILLATLAASGVLLLTQSRMGYLGFAAVFPFVIIGNLPRRARRWGLVGAGLLVVAAFTAAVMAWTAPEANAYAGIGDGFTLRSLSARIEIWSRAIYGIQDFAFTGMGMNTFRRVVHVLYPLFTIAPDKDIAHAHSNFLQAALDLGIPGLIAYLALLLGSLAMLVERWKRRQEMPFPPGLARACILGLGGGLIGHSVYGLLDAIALGAKPGILFWWLLGLIAALYRHQAVSCKQ